MFSDGPTGPPHLEPSTSSKHMEENVILICNNPVDDGNPDCDDYTWKRIGRSEVIPLPMSKTLESNGGKPSRKLYLHLQEQL